MLWCHRETPGIPMVECRPPTPDTHANLSCTQEPSLPLCVGQHRSPHCRVGRWLDLVAGLAGGGWPPQWERRVSLSDSSGQLAREVVGPNTILPSHRSACHAPPKVEGGLGEGAPLRGGVSLCALAAGVKDVDFKMWPSPSDCHWVPPYGVPCLVPHTHPHVSPTAYLIDPLWLVDCSGHWEQNRDKNKTRNQNRVCCLFSHDQQRQLAQRQLARESSRRRRCR
jgi:hypothetical protein